MFKGVFFLIVSFVLSVFAIGLSLYSLFGVQKSAPVSMTLSEQAKPTTVIVVATPTATPTASTSSVLNKRVVVPTQPVVVSPTVVK